MTAIEAAALLLAVNPPRTALGLPASVDRRPVVAGAGLALLVLVGLAAAATPLLRWLAVVAPTLRLGVGVVVALAGAADLVTAPPDPAPTVARVPAAVAPLAFPLLLRPAAGAAALALGADAGLGPAVVAAVVALGAVAAFRTPPRTPGARRVVTGAARLAGASAVLAGAALTVDGIFSL